MAESASRLQLPTDAGPTVNAETPSLDPAAVERAYRRERARRRARGEQRQYARNSNARFWVMLAVLALLTVLMSLTAFREIQTNFGIFQ
jgi:hypothetical protein